MIKTCRYRIKYKGFNCLQSSGIIYKCTLANTLLISKDLNDKWACGGCSVPKIMVNRPCKYLKPHKNFLIRGSSHTWYSCELFNIIMDLPTEFCHTYCKMFEPN